MFSTKIFIVFTLYSLTLDSISGKPFVDGLTACKRSDPNLDECLLNMLKQTKPQLIQGNPELNLPPLDPVHIPRVSVYKNMQDIRVTGELSNLTAKGASSITFKALKVNLRENTWDMVIAVPLITFVTDFNLNVTLKVILMPVFGNGLCDGKISRSVVRFHANTEVKDGKLKLNDIKINLSLGDVEVHIIKSQNPTLAQTTSQFFNTNKRMILDLVTPVAEDVVRQMLLRYSNRILSTIEITDLLID
ncbi:protein takeout-like [Melanaphis sacchari]|uniref:protein takeout-like n=1 Tax=Melanaphis sacchari TaxID=742174 RepID=UPI000DC15A71|nr:protein takeout-like [Melanaphis sacchari]XP_025198803.1 protein takeout-like [Melanaphis sacchari]XP_025198808.1 protein takeout-like [Melanaphis sacchari]